METYDFNIKEMALEELRDNGEHGYFLNMYHESNYSGLYLGFIEERILGLD